MNDPPTAPPRRFAPLRAIRRAIRTPKGLMALVLLALLLTFAFFNFISRTSRKNAAARAMSAT